MEVQYCPPERLLNFGVFLIVMKHVVWAHSGQRAMHLHSGAVDLLMGMLWMALNVHVTWCGLKEMDNLILCWTPLHYWLQPIYWALLSRYNATVTSEKNRPCNDWPGYLRIQHQKMWSHLLRFPDGIGGMCCAGTLQVGFLPIESPGHSPKTPRKLWGFLGFFLRCQVGDSAYTYPGPQNRPPLLTPSFTRCIWYIRRDSTEPPTGDARLAENTHSQHSSSSNDFWARRSIGCLAPPLSCFRDLFSVGSEAERGCFSHDGAIWLSSDRNSIASCFRYLL